MLDRIREGSQGITAKVILGLVILTFAISGIGSYINSKADTAVTSVNGVEITQSAVEDAFQNERNRMKSQFGDVVEQLMADESYVANFKKGILDRLIVEELQRQQAKDLGIRVGDEQIKKTILEMPEFQRDGKFDNEVYLALLRQAGFQPSQFRDYLRSQMTRSQYSTAIMSSEFVLPYEKKQYAALNNQTRTFDQVTVLANQLKSQITLTDEDVQTYFENNKFSYKTQDKVSVEYILINADSMAENVVVTDEALLEYYELNIAEFSTPEQRRIAHILVEAADDAETKIADIKAKLDAGESFESVAKAFSEDTFSAENGGDLEWFEAGIFGDAFDDAILSLESQGEISEVFESEAGFHIAKMTEFVAAKVSKFEDVKDAIAKQFKQSKIDELYIDAQTKIAQIAFEIPDTLEDAAEVTGLELKKTAMLTANELQRVLNSQTAVAKAFDETFINEGLNSDLIDIDDTNSIVLRVVNNEPSRLQKLEEVKASVEAAVLQEKVSQLAVEKSDEIAEQIKAGTGIETLIKSAFVKAEVFKDVSRFDSKVNATVRDAAFDIAKPVAGNVQVETVSLNNGDSAIIVLRSVATKDAAVEAPINNQLLSVVAQQATKALIEASKANADIGK